jgi:tRNA threonylcarbamoyladenosine biosynthesis protein TsaE
MTLPKLPCTLTLPTPQATQAWGENFAKQLTEGTVLLLEGDLGTGKTSLVQGIGLGLGINDPIVSPTFTLINEYYEGQIPLYHLDLYRLSPQEVDALYLDQYWQGEEFPLGIVAIEWPERLSHLPDSYWLIELMILPEGRQLRLDYIK